MLKEYINVRQFPEGYRRLFQDDYFDLFIWYDHQDGEIIGFQLVYNKYNNPHSLTWSKDLGYSHNKIDDGEDSCLFNNTPILVNNGLFKDLSVRDKFEKTSINLEKSLRDFIKRHINIAINTGIGNSLV